MSSEMWVAWGRSGRWHLLSNRTDRTIKSAQIVTACGAWTWASTPHKIAGFPGSSLDTCKRCERCEKKRGKLTP